MKIKLLTLFLFLVFVGKAQYRSKIQEEVLTGGIVVNVQDPMYLSTAPNFTDAKNSFFIEFGKLANPSVYVSGYHNYEIKFGLKSYNQEGVLLLDTILELEVEADDAGNVTELNKHRYKGSGAYRLEVEVLEFKDLQTMNVQSEIEDIYYLETGIDVERYWDFSGTAPGATTISDSLIDLDGDFDADEIEVYWNYYPGASAYELQWTYVDNFGSKALSNLTASQVSFSHSDFKNNASSVVVTNNSFRIPLVYDKGFVIYRYRAIGKGGPTALDYSHNIYSGWSSESSLPSCTAGTVSCFAHKEIGNSFVQGGSTYYTVAHENDKNWQYSATYAENGKKKEVLSYFDGSNRNRQSVTRISTEEKAIVGETYYDYRGRPAVQAFPTPVISTVNNNYNTDNKLGFYESFNRNSATNPYNVADFDSAVSCISSVNVMNELYGASLYYSDNNPEQNGQQAFLPDANGFPFTRTEYTPDNTGRISRQGGVGDMHEPGDHDTRYFYVKPWQEELNRLFGLEVGSSAHYKKNVVIDPNGQASVSYLDMQGRTIATALAGDAPSNLDALTDGGQELQTSSGQSLTVSLIGGNQTMSMDGKTRIMNAQHGVTKDVDHDLSYSLNFPFFTSNCGNFQPIVDIDIVVQDECGVKVDSLSFSTTEGNTSAQSNLTYSASYSDEMLTIGNYLIQKTVKLNQDSLDVMVDKYIADGQASGCIDDLNDMYAAIVVDTVSCNTTCAECDSFYVYTYKGGNPSAPLDTINVGDPDYIESEALYNQYIAECWEPCSYTSPCKSRYEQMKLDVSPHGQYGRLEYNDFEEAFGDDVLSLFNPDNKLPYSLLNPSNKASWKTPRDEAGFSAHYLDDDGTEYKIDVVKGLPANTISVTNGEIYPEELMLVEDFRLHWKHHWSELLVIYHPEFGQKQYCDVLTVQYYNISGSDYISAEDYEFMLMDMSVPLTAKEIYRSSQTIDLSAFTTGSFYSILNNDPIYNNGDANYSLSNSTFKTRLFNAVKDVHGTGMDIFDLAANSLICGQWYGSNACISSYSSLSAAQKLEANKMAVAFYIAIRQDFIGQWFDTPKYISGVVVSNTYSGNIGANFSFNSTVPSLSGLNPKKGAPVYRAVRHEYQDRHRIYPSAFIGDGDVKDEVLKAKEAIYNQTGQCPLTFDTQHWIKQLYEDGLLESALTTDFATTLGCSPDLYAKMTGISYTVNGNGTVVWGSIYPPTGGSVLNVVTSFTGGNSTANIVLSNASNTYGVLTLTFQSGSGYTWGDPEIIEHILEIKNASFSAGITSFDLVVQMKDGYFEYIAGTINHDIVDCSSLTSNGNLVVSKEMQALQSLMSELANNTNGSQTDFSQTSGVDLHTQVSSTSPQDEYEIIMSPVISTLLVGTATDDWQWKNVGSSDQFKIYDNSLSNDNELIVEFCSSTTVNYSKILSFHNLKLISSSIICSNINPNVEAEVIFTNGSTTDTATVYMEIYLINSIGLRTYINTGHYESPDFVNSVSCTVDEAIFYKELKKMVTHPNFLNPNLTVSANPGTSSDAVISAQLGFAIAQEINWANLNNLNVIDSGATTGSYIRSNFTEDLGLVGEIANPVCMFELSLVNAGSKTIGDINYIRDFYPNMNTASNGVTYDFIGVALMNDGSFERVRGKSCVPLTICETCIPFENNFTGLLDCGTTWNLYDAAMANFGVLTGFPLEAKSDFCQAAVGECSYDYSTFLGMLDVHGESGLSSDYYVEIKSFSMNELAFYLDDYTYYLEHVSGGSALSLPTKNDVLYATLVDFSKVSISKYTVLAYEFYIDNLIGNDTIALIDFATGEDSTLVWLPLAFPCSDFPVLPLPDINFEIKSPCATRLLNMDTANVNVAYQQYIDDLKAEFISDYVKHFTNATETMDLVYTDYQYHYTLYYYDQAGNLVRTVPPAGVSLVPSTDWPTIDIKRGNGETDYYTQHTLKTTYEYNSLNQLIRQNTPDGNETEFWYDELGRLVLSQNAKQGSTTLSYSKYDALGRITEVGEVNGTAPVSQNVDATTLNGILSGTKIQVTKTFYDVPALDYSSINTYYGTWAQENSRSRVAAIAYYHEYSDSSPQHTTYYSYDIHGNVKSLVQDNQINFTTSAQRFKRIDYSYDLVSGNVNQVAYQEGYWDQFFHRYTYDADNRIVSAETSVDKEIWSADAHYDYYQHGPLARTEIGENQVQGMDYVYTLHGWLKGVNSPTLDESRDPGLDGNSGVHQPFGRDAMGFMLSYYSGDYASTTTSSFAPTLMASAYETGMKNLYNGNIRGMVTGISDLAESRLKIQGAAYNYDQLNRLTKMAIYKDNAAGDRIADSNTFINATTDTDHQTSLTYDANGNILSLSRYGDVNLMDNLSYSYNAGTNQLNHVDDGVSSGTYAVDIDDQLVDNYTYDAIGNLKSDQAEEISNIEWTTYGKIKKITRSGGSKDDLEFFYDASGNRMAKVSKPKVDDESTWTYTYYVRDASGNVMATYSQVIERDGENWERKLQLAERNIYGSSRIGLEQTNLIEKELVTLNTEGVYTFVNYSGTLTTPTLDNMYFSSTFGNKMYELSNHLGNVLATVSDRKYGNDDNADSLVDYFKPDVISFSDYYPFGMLQPGRNGSSGNYRYGFNGMEKDDEVSGNGNQYTTYFRQYDSRIGRWLSYEPKPIANESPYAAFRNNPIYFNDPNGDCPDGDCPDVKWGKNANKGAVNENSLSLLKDIASEAGLESFVITSTSRTPKDQARAMYNNIVNKGTKSQYKLYGRFGDMVIDSYVEAKKAGGSPGEIKQAMTDKMNKIGPGNVSKHVADQTKLNVLDIAPSSIPYDQRASFVKAVEQAVKDGRVSKFLHPGNSNDPAYHIEIPVLSNNHIIKTKSQENKSWNFKKGVGPMDLEEVMRKLHWEFKYESKVNLEPKSIPSLSERNN